MMIHMDGVAVRNAEGLDLRFERVMDHPVERVWEAISTESLLAVWLFRGTVELTPGGVVDLYAENSGDRISGTVTEVEPPRILEYTWRSQDAEATLVRFELDAGNDTSSTLVFTHRVGRGDDAAAMLAGWHCHLDMLAALLAGHDTTWPSDTWRRRYDGYQRSIAAG